MLILTWTYALGPRTPFAGVKPASCPRYAPAPVRVTDVDDAVANCEGVQEISSITTNSVAVVSAGLVMLLPNPPIKIDVLFPALVLVQLAVLLPARPFHSYT